MRRVSTAVRGRQGEIRCERELRGVGVDPHREANIAVTHQFHHDAGRRTGGREFGAEGVAQGVDIDPATALVPERNAGGGEILPQPVGTGDARFPTKHEIRWLDVGGLYLPERRDQFRPQRERGGFPVLGETPRDRHPWRRALQVEITPRECVQFLATQPGAEDQQIDGGALGRSDGQKAMDFVAGYGAPIRSDGVVGHALHRLQRVRDDVHAFFHPVEQREHRPQLVAWPQSFDPSTA